MPSAGPPASASPKPSVPSHCGHYGFLDARVATLNGDRVQRRPERGKVKDAPGVCPILTRLRLEVLPEWLRLDWDAELAVDSDRLVLDLDRSTAMSPRSRALACLLFELRRSR